MFVVMKWRSFLFSHTSFKTYIQKFQSGVSLEHYKNEYAKYHKKTKINKHQIIGWSIIFINIVLAHLSFTTTDNKHFNLALAPVVLNLRSKTMGTHPVVSYKKSTVISLVQADHESTRHGTV